MKNIHIIPTDKPSRLHLIEDVLMFTNEYKNSVCDSEVNIYITSDEEIKDVRPHKGKWQLEKGQILNQFPDYLTDLSECKLVIMTTGPQLIADGIQAIDDEFLEWFVKNPSCEEVEVFKDFFQVNQNNPVLKGSTALAESYKIIIPQEEPKQETIEEAADIERIAMDKLKNKWGHLYTFGYPQKPFPTNYENDLNNIKIGLYEGAKWQQEQDKNKYSEEEVYEILAQFVNDAPTITKEWFEGFKKK